MSDLLAVLQAFHRDKLAALVRHQAGARWITPYDVNNTYQYIINRDEVQLAWLEHAVAELGASVDEGSEPAPAGRAGGPDRWRRIVEDDALEAQAFVDRWRPRVGRMTDARHARLLDVILGETLEHRRFFEQARAGRTDLLGRRAEQLGPAHGEVLPTRWIE